MKKQTLGLLAIALAPACAFAVDGVTLINQSSVMASGGFPYKIAAAGSYQLSGNLAAPAGKQAILIAASNVVLDLNGFNVSCSLGADAGDTNPFLNCVGDSGAFPSGISDVTVVNGTVTLTQTEAPPEGAFTNNVAVGFRGTPNMIIEKLHVPTVNLATSGSSPTGLAFGLDSIIRRNILSGSGNVNGVVESCPSILDENVNTTLSGIHFGQGCILVNNVGVF